MYGQGNYAPQFRHGPPGPPLPPRPPFQQAPPGPSLPVIQHGSAPHPQIPQAPSGPPSLTFQHSPAGVQALQPIRPPPPTAVNMGQHYGHPPPSAHGRAPVVPSYAQPGPSFTPPMSGQNAHLASQLMPPPPRMFAPQPPPPSQGQVLYRTPTPPPGNQHMPAPPLPPPSSFVTINPLPSASFGIASGVAHPPSLPPSPPPPPPPPPSSPPPLPPSPPPPTFPVKDFSVAPKAPSFDSVVDEFHMEHVTSKSHHAYNVTLAGSSTSVAGHTEKKVSQLEALVLPSPPPKPADEEVLRNIEVLCQFIAKVGPDFENMARMKEANNPRFAFLFGGELGSAAAIGHDYFQWMKKKCRLEMQSNNVPEQSAALSHNSYIECSSEYGNLENEPAVTSPTGSDMDMEDDVALPDGDSSFDRLNKVTTGEPLYASTEKHFVNEPLQAHRVTVEQFIPDGGGSIKNGEGDKDSLIIQDVSPVRASTGAAGCSLDDGVRHSGGPTTGNLDLANEYLPAAVGKAVEVPRVFVNDGSPFRLIQGYATDDSGDDDKDYADDVSCVGASTSAAANTQCLDKNRDSELRLDVRRKEDSARDTGFSLLIDSRQPFSTMPKQAVSSIHNSPSQNSVSTGVVCGSPDDAIKNRDDNAFDKENEQRVNERTGTFMPSQDKSVLEGESIDVDHLVGKLRPEDGNPDSAIPKLDEFGRLVKEGLSEDDSDEIRYNERRSKRGRSRSHSRSPQESRRRRRSRSPWKRDKRSRSRSWSPKRGRSKSPPASRRANLFARRDRDHPPECFNFIRGRCFRGASCRFLHRDAAQHRSKQQHWRNFTQDSANHGENDDAPILEKSPCAKSTVRVMSAEKSNIARRKEEKSPELRTPGALSETSAKTTKEISLDGKLAFGSVHSALSSLENDATERLVTDQASREIDSQAREPQEVNKSHVALNLDDTEEEQSQPLPTHMLPIQTSSEGLVQGNSGDSTSIALPIQASQIAAFQNQVPAIRPNSEHAPVTEMYQIQSPISQSFSNHGPINQQPNQPLLPKVLPPPTSLAPDVRSQPPQLPLAAPQGHPSLLIPADNINTSYGSRHPRENPLPPVSSFHSQPLPLDMLPSHRPPIASDYHSHSLHPPNPMWSNQPLPPPPPPPPHVNALPSRPAFPTEHPPLQFQQSAMPPRNDFHQPSMGQYPPREHIHSQDQPFREDCLSRPPNPEGPRIVSGFKEREHNLHHPPPLGDDVRVPFPGQGPMLSSSYSQGSVMYSHSIPLARESVPNQSHRKPGDDLPPRLFSREELPFAKELHYSHHQASYGQQRPASSNYPSNLGGPRVLDPSFQRFPSSFADSVPPQLSSGIGVPKISAHYNPYASTFEQAPTSSKFGANASGQGLNSGHGPGGGHGLGLSASPPHLGRSGHQFLPRSGAYARETSAELLPDGHRQFLRESASGAPYDPLFDSIEPSSSTRDKLDLVDETNHSANDAGPIPKVSSLTRPADMEDNFRQKGDMGLEPKSEVDEFGEVATDGEVGAVENGSPQAVDAKDWSPGIPDDMGNTAAGEIEVDQVRSPKKSKKSKDSRSMKLFKIALADFVKEVLKPSWRQGNMSKEAFKTIVKKTVDKVSGAIPSHQIPKTQAKINQYVESSQRKLTKLVMGYVDKYVKM